MKSIMLVLSAVASAAIIGCATSECSSGQKCADKRCEAQKNCASGGQECGCAKAPARPLSPSCRTSKLPYKLGVARYTLHKQTFDRALEMLQDMDVHYMGLMSGSIEYGASDEEIAAYKARRFG